MEYSWTEPRLWITGYGRSKPGPFQFSSIGREKSAVAKWRRWNHRPDKPGTRSGRLFFRNPRGGWFPPRNDLHFPDTSKYRDNFPTFAAPERIFRHIRWAETNFKTFLLSLPPSNLNLFLAVTNPSRFFPFESRITNLSFFLSSFFYFLQGATLQGKTRLNRGAEGMDDNRFRFPVEFVSMSWLREGWFLPR